MTNERVRNEKVTDSSMAALRSVVIFGGAGFIGSNWAHWLLAHTEAKVHVFDNLSREGVRQNLAVLQQAAGSSGRLEITVGDVRDRKLVEAAICGATEVYHFAAQVAVTTSLTDPRLDFEVNALGTFNVLEAVRRSGKKPFLLFTSTNKVYGDLGKPAVIAEGDRYRFRDIEAISEMQPLDFHSPYGCSKGAADQYVHDFGRIYGIPAVVFRMSCIAGPRQFGTEDQGWVAHFLYAAMAGEPVTIFGDGRQVRDVLGVNDLMEAFEAARSHPAAHGQIFNVGGGAANTVSLLELGEHIHSLTGRRLSMVFDQARPGDQRVYVSDHSKLTTLTGWAPRNTVAETLAQILAWHAEQGPAVHGEFAKAVSSSSSALADEMETQDQMEVARNPLEQPAARAPGLAATEAA